MRDTAQSPPALRPPEPANVPRLALRLNEAAESLGVCAKWLADLEDGPPRVAIGRMTLYPIDLLTAWLRDRAKEKNEADAAADGGARE